MRKVILSVAVSLDGFIEGPQGEYDWCPPPFKKEMDAFMQSIDAIFFGRKSFELAGTSMFPGKKYYVFSNTMKTAKGKDIQIVNGDIVKFVHAIKKTEGKDIWLFGGASLTSTFINHELVDEMWLGVVPIVLGKGKPLFENIDGRKLFKTEEATVSKGYFSLRLKK
ncbi:hypothetical protein WSM22_07680 [Cytophagales bacterium WSM2-2]|nr:hypothetical protein WSM22_07680 [Cytophagales bacterium WSM2-2]